MGAIQGKQCDFKEALQSYQFALDIRIKLFGEEHQRTAECYRLLSKAQFRLGDFKAARQSRQRKRDIRNKLSREHQSTA